MNQSINQPTNTHPPPCTVISIVLLLLLIAFSALKHHPDKQNTEESRREGSTIFAKISNAYEILSDPEQRQEYDNKDRRSYNNGGSNGNSNDRRRSSAQHDFYSFSRGGGDAGFQFHDPWEIFNRVFREEFGQHQQQNHGSGNPGSTFQRPFRRNSMGASPFAPFMGMGMMGGGGSPFDDPFFSGGMGNPMGRNNNNTTNSNNNPMVNRSHSNPSFGFGGFGGFGGDPFAMMNGGGINMNMNMNTMNMNGMNGNTMTSSFSTSSTTSGMGENGFSTSTSTTVRIVNGQRQIVRETTIRKPDGTVEHRVETEGVDNQQQQPRLPASNRTPRHPGGRRRPQLTHRLSSSSQQLTDKTSPVRKRAKKSDNK